MNDTTRNHTKSPEEILCTNYREFQELINKAEAACTSGALEKAARMLQAAANLAWKRKTGLFSCAPLEALLGRIAKEAGVCDRPHPETRPHVKTARRVLHIFSGTYAIGGHSRLAQRWMVLDTASRHDAVSTQ